MVVYSVANDSYAADNAYAIGLNQELIFLAVDDSTPAAWSIVRELALPIDALVDEAVFTVTSAPAGRTTAGDIAEVRAATPEFLDEDDGAYAVVVDFGQMVSITDISSPIEPKHVLAWSGTGFTFAGNEINTERLMLEFEGPGGIDNVLRWLSFDLPTWPTGLEVAIDGTTVWFERQGSSAGLEAPTDAVGHRVDLTQAVAGALAAKVAARSLGSGSSDTEIIAVELRAATPGFLNLEESVSIRRVHQVAFSDGPARSFDLASEGPLAIELPLPSEAASWTVDSVEVVARATLPDERVAPADGPSFSSDGRLALSPERTLLGRVPAQLAERFAEVTGLRLAVRGGTDGGELGGRLLADAGTGPDSTAPGDPLPGGDLTPITIEPGTEVQWVTLATSTAVPAGPLWVELLVGYGELEWELTTSPDTDSEAPGTAVFHRRAGGPLQPLTVLAEIGQQLGSLRLVGRPDPNRPLDAVRLSIADDEAGALPFTPSRDGVTARIGATVTVTPIDGVVELRGVAAVAGAYTFESVRVTYREGAS